MEYVIQNGELYHYGVKGMKWGVRRASKYATRYVRGHGGTGNYLTKKRQLAGDKRDLEKLNRGEHLSVGLTKKRQAKYDARDRKALEKRIAKNESKVEKKQLTPEEKAARNKKLVKAGVAIAGTALAAYGAYKFHEYIRNENRNIAIKRGNEAFDKVFRDDDAKIEKLSRMSSEFRGKAIDNAATVTRFKNAAKDSGSYRRKAMFENEAAAAEALREKYVDSANRARRLSSKLVVDPKHRAKVRKMADDAFVNAYNSTKNANFLDATKNVYDEYRKRKRK